MSVHRLTNLGGLEMRVATRGAIIMSLLVPGRAGALDDVVLGFHAEDDYDENPLYFGAVIGRCANRIAHGRFVLDGVEHSLARNEGLHHLHGGRRGFDRADWTVEEAAGDRILLSHTSPDGDEGYPGTLRVRVCYRLTAHSELVVDYRALTDRPTPVNLTQHSYFNLSGHGAGDVLDHIVVIEADRFTPIDGAKIPTGELRDVTGTPFDFRRPMRLGDRIDGQDEQLRIAGGYDHNFVLSGRGDESAAAGSGMRRAALVADPGSGRTLEVRTTEPGMQLYLPGAGARPIAGKQGVLYGARCGVALETQHFPDSPNQPTFPSTILRPGAELHSRTVYRFGSSEV